MNLLPDKFSDSTKQLFRDIIDLFLESSLLKKNMIIQENEVYAFGDITKQPGYNISNIVMHGDMRDDTFVVPSKMTIYIATRIATPLKAYPLSYTLLKSKIKSRLQRIQSNEEYEFITNFLEYKLNNIEFLRAAIGNIQQNSTKICYNPGSLCPNISLTHDPTSDLETYVTNVKDYAHLTPQETEELKHTQKYLITKVNIPEPQFINLAELVQQQLPLNKHCILIVTACIRQAHFHWGFDLDCLGHFQYPIAGKDRSDLLTVVTGQLTETQKQQSSLLEQPIIYADFYAAMKELEQNPDKEYEFDNLITYKLLYKDKYYEKDVLKLEIPLRNFNFLVFRRAFLNTFKPVYYDIIATKQDKLFQSFLDIILDPNRVTEIPGVLKTMSQQNELSIRFWLYQFFNLLRKYNDIQNNAYVMYIRTSEIGAYTNPERNYHKSSSSEFGRKWTSDDARKFKKLRNEINQAKTQFTQQPRPFLDNYNICFMILLFQCITDARNPSTCRFDPNKIQDLINNAVQPNETYEMLHGLFVRILKYLHQLIVNSTITVPQLPPTKRPRSTTSEKDPTKRRK
jgi:hypothetical protein